MSRRALGISLMIGGAALVAIGLVGWSSAGQPQQTAAASTTIASQTTPAPQTTATEPATTIPTTTTSEPVTTTTIPPTTTTTIDTDAAIETFVELFADAIAREDVELLFATLHPAVVSLFDEATCREFIADEILQLGEYRLIGEVEGPTTQSVAGMTVEMFRGPVAFTFQGEDFSSEAAFAFEGLDVRWFTQCGE